MSDQSLKKKKISLSTKNEFISFRKGSSTDEQMNSNSEIVDSVDAEIDTNVNR
jgi:hypothetical protein